jgi:hypothetical protein
MGARVMPAAAGGLRAEMSRATFYFLDSRYLSGRSYVRHWLSRMDEDKYKALDLGPQGHSAQSSEA